MNGLRLKPKNEAALVSWMLKKPRLPYLVRLPLPLSPELHVTAGDFVRAGQKIADSQDPSGIPLFASVFGRVQKISPWVEIQSEDRDEAILPQERPGWQALSAPELISLFRDRGLRELDDQAFALHEIVGRSGPRSVLIINACESEPYVTSDYALVMSHAPEILKGAEILRRAYGAKKLVITLQQEGREAAELLKSKIYFLKWDHAEVRVLPSVYPQDMLHPLVRAVTGKDLLPQRREALRSGRSRNDPWLDRDLLEDAEAALHDAATAFAVYEAVVMQKPFYERALTVAGECVIEPKNLWIPLGLSAGDALKACRGLMREPAVVVLNGPLRGRTLTEYETPLGAGDRALLALPKELVASGPEEACTRCGKCAEVCPAGIFPVFIAEAAGKGLTQEAESWGAGLCFHCGSCTYSCPSRLPLDERVLQAEELLFPAR